MTSVKQRLRDGGLVTVCNTDYPTPALVEFVAEIGFDAVFIDCEHSATDFREVENLARAARGAGMASVVRPWSQEPELANRYLSCGVDGIQVPHVDDVQQARAAIDGLSHWEGDHTAKLLVAMIESERAIDNLPGLLELEEIDVFYVGAFDLAASMGLKGQATHPRVRARVDEAIGRVAAAGRAPGINLQNDLNALSQYRDLGLRWINVHLKVFMRDGARAFLKAARGEV